MTYKEAITLARSIAERAQAEERQAAEREAALLEALRKG